MSLIDYRKGVLKLTQTQMAEALGISESYYIKIEQGKKNPAYGFLRKLHKSFPEFDINSLFK